MLGYTLLYCTLLWHWCADGTSIRSIQSDSRPLMEPLHGDMTDPSYVISMNLKLDNILDLLRKDQGQCRGESELEKTLQTVLDDIRLEVNKLKNSLTEVTEDLLFLKDGIKVLENKNSAIPETTYVRWGRTTCPGNGSDPIYDGFAGGSWYGHSGAAVSMLCLPKDPDWEGGKYNDVQDTMSGFVYGAEYQDGFQRSDNLFGTNHLDKDVPCVVCNVKQRSSAIMVPGKTKCNVGWTFEYSGYLMSGRWDHSAASDYYCIDKQPEDLTDGGYRNEDGLPLYFVEARCGSLKCPPYIDGREMRCVVCTK